MNLNKTCPDCGQIILLKIKQCTCGWREPEKMNYLCHYKENTQSCRNIATIAGRYGQIWYCKEHWRQLRELGEL